MVWDNKIMLSKGVGQLADLLHTVTRTLKRGHSQRSSCVHSLRGLGADVLYCSTGP